MYPTPLKSKYCPWCTGLTMGSGVVQCVARTSEIKLTWEDMLTLRIFLITLDIVAITVVLLWNRKMLWRGTSAPDTHSSEIQFILCLDVSNTIEEQVLSMMYRSESGNWCCSVCGKEFKIKNDMKRHVESLHIINHPGYVCNYCGDTVKSKNALRLHISSKHPYQWNEIYQNKMKWYYLLFYSEVSDRIEEYISSMMYQSETRSWICSECGKESKLKTDITRHVEAKHITNHPGYRCNYCGEYSKTKNALRVHISTRHPFKWEKSLFYASV